MEPELLTILTTHGATGLGTAVLAVYIANKWRDRNGAGNGNGTKITEARFVSLEGKVKGIHETCGDIKTAIDGIREDGRERERKNAEDHAKMREAIAVLSTQMKGLQSAPAQAA